MDDQQFNDDLVDHVLTEVWGSHCRILGPDYVKTIKEAAIRRGSIESLLTTSEGGEDFSWELSVQILYHAVAATWAIIQVYDKLKSQRIMPPSAEELSEEKEITQIVEEVRITPVSTELKRTIILICTKKAR